MMTRLVWGKRGKILFQKLGLCQPLRTSKWPPGAGLQLGAIAIWLSAQNLNLGVSQTKLVKCLQGESECLFIYLLMF